MTQNTPPHIAFLSCGIGRGHPFYLDGIHNALQKNYPNITTDYTTVFEVSKTHALACWKLARWLYVQGASSPLIKRGYQQLRRSNDYNKASRLLDVLNTDLRKQYMQSQYPLVVDHPILVAALRGRSNLYYQHGELVVPDEALVRGAAGIFVPTKTAKQVFVNAGFAEVQLLVSGLCIESEVVAQAEAVYSRRLVRLQSSAQLTGAYFSSGAEPKEHRRMIIDAALSAIKNGQQAIVFARAGGRLARLLQGEISRLRLVVFSSREELDRLTAALFSEFDYLVAPSHERSNWAVGLGLPMFIVEPAIGTFSPRNRELLLQENVAVSLTRQIYDIPFSERLSAMQKSGQLAAMSRAGWGKYPIDGFAQIASFLAIAVKAI